MRRALFIAAGFSLALAGPVRPQVCLSVSDGLGGTTISCPDGRTGYVHDLGAGAAGGMIGSQPFAGASASLAPPFGPPPGLPSTTFIAPPLAPPSPAPNAASQDPGPPPLGPATAGQPGLGEGAGRRP